MGRVATNNAGYLGLRFSLLAQLEDVFHISLPQFLSVEGSPFSVYSMAR